MRLLPFFIFLISSQQYFVAPSAAQTSKAHSWQATCTRYRNTPLPSSLRAPQTPNSKSCISVSSYYGLGIPVDYTEARRCAVLERAGVPTHAVTAITPQDAPDRIGIEGPTMLAMLYGNGDGVPRNKDLALRFACEAIDAGAIAPPYYSEPDNPDEDQAIFPKLLSDIVAAGKDTRAHPNEKIDMCNYVEQQGRLLSTCDYIVRLREGLQRRAEIESFADRFTPDQKTAYLRLVAAFEAYAVAHDDNEIVVLGHYPSTARWERQPLQEQQFIAEMRQFESGDLPTYTADEYAVADRDLNAQYREAMQTAGQPNPKLPDDIPRPPADNLRNTERLWLSYRDSWVTFGRLRYTQVSAASWLTWATHSRLEELKSFGELLSN